MVGESVDYLSDCLWIAVVIVEIVVRERERLCNNKGKRQCIERGKV